MGTTVRRRAAAVLFAVAALWLFSGSYAWSAHLPLMKDLTVRLSTLSGQGRLQTVSEIVARTDAVGKITFSFPVVPSSASAPFLHIQIMDGATVLRQAIVPSPQAGGNADVGVSEVTDLQARSLLGASAISGRLTPLHLLVAQALLHTAPDAAAHAESIGSAIAAGADAMAAVLSADGLTADQEAAFTGSLSRGLSAAAAMYRKSVDDSVVFDGKVEAYRRGEAYAALLQSLVTAGLDAGINLETLSTAFAAAGEATEAAIESNPTIDPVAKAGMRFGFVSGILSLSNYRMVRELMDSLSYVGISPDYFPRISYVLELVLLNTTNTLKGAIGSLWEYSSRNDIAGLRVQEFNAVAVQDLLLLKMGMESYVFPASPESVALMLEITSRMAGTGGIMTVMTPETLMEIFNRSTFLPPFLDPETQSSFVPTLTPYELAAWSYVHAEPTFVYTPIPGLIDQLVVKPTVIPQFDKLAEPYKSLALLMYDLSMIGDLRWQDQNDAEADLIANPANPPRWYPLAAVHRILENNRQRLSLVRQHMSGVSPKTKDALIYLLGHNRLAEF